MHENDRHKQAKREFVVVTGASSGIGRATASALSARGYKVLAGVRGAPHAARLGEAAGFEPVMVDITKSADVAALAERVGEVAGANGLRALVNNAGIAVNAPVEALPMAEWRRQFEVNFFGHVAVTQALMPALSNRAAAWSTSARLAVGSRARRSGPMRRPSSRWRR
jgi:NAD(P)-dependent dehydrogenase (short-subunit alcohol dehydrogenase family)